MRLDEGFFLDGMSFCVCEEWSRPVLVCKLFRTADLNLVCVLAVKIRIFVEDAVCSLGPVSQMDFRS